MSEGDNSDGRDNDSGKTNWIEERKSGGSNEEITKQRGTELEKQARCPKKHEVM